MDTVADQTAMVATGSGFYSMISSRIFVLPMLHINQVLRNRTWVAISTHFTKHEWYLDVRNRGNASAKSVKMDRLDPCLTIFDSRGRTQVETPDPTINLDIGYLAIGEICFVVDPAQSVMARSISFLATFDVHFPDLMCFTNTVYNRWPMLQRKPTVILRVENNWHLALEGERAVSFRVFCLFPRSSSHNPLPSLLNNYHSGYTRPAGTVCSPLNPMIKIKDILAIMLIAAQEIPAPFFAAVLPAD